MSHTLPEPTVARDWPESLKVAGFKVTKQRLAVLHAVEHHPHADAELIAANCRETLPALTIQSVYTVLADLTRAGLVRKIQPHGGAARYETRTNDNHHHAVCIRCDRIVDVDCAVGHTPCLVPQQDTGMNILFADVVYRGVCEECQREPLDLPVN
ncbi:Fur family transcriptional regulator [Haematomicrobium sanguinis]|uniref:Fur family transcriptional regulator n=1 Tax=Haematomicrobium sanguinis TaxID=479106 RepID=UPI0005576AB4|nr:Fur family transcriptional regulator [Haematomicrobium sanguinis]